MPAIIQDTNVNSLWTGHVAATAALVSGITHYRLYCAQHGDQPKAYRFVSQYANPGGGALALGTISYGALGLQMPNRPFFLKLTSKMGLPDGQESELAAEPVLAVVPSAVSGWTLGQLVEQSMRPVIVVGFDPISGLYYPLNVVAEATGFKLKT